MQVAACVGEVTPAEDWVALASRQCFAGTTAQYLGGPKELASALSNLNVRVATVARPWDFRTLASAATLILRHDKVLVQQITIDGLPGTNTSQTC